MTQRCAWFLSLIAVFVTSFADTNLAEQKKWNDSNFLKQFLSCDQNELSRLNKSQENGIIEFAPVILPEGKNLIGENDYFGWPVATMVDDTIVVVFLRKPGHWGKRTAEGTSHAVAVRSTDGGKTWSDMINIEDACIHKSGGVKAGFGNAICTSEGIIYLVSGQSGGVFTSKDKGLSWQNIPKAFTSEQINGPRTSLGPNIIEHPEYGFVVFGHEGGKTFPSDIYFRYSKDKCVTWHDVKYRLPDFARSAESAGVFYNNALFLLGRSHGGVVDPKTKTYSYVQIVAKSGWVPLEASLTNIRTTDASDWKGGSGNKGFGVFSQDTAAFIFNPISGRLEAVTTNRTGGGPIT